MPRFLRLSLPALALALALTGCDAASTDVSPGADAQTDTEDAAVSIAAAIALDGGGVLDEMAAAASASVPADALDGGRGPSDNRPGCARDRSYDETAMLWTMTVRCRRGDPDGRFFAAFGRQTTVQFLLGGQPQQSPDGADALVYRIVRGQSIVRRPFHVQRVTSLSADFDVTDLDMDLVTVNGTYQRAGADSLRVRRSERTLVYTLDLVATDVQGPRRVYANWRTAVSGTLTGHYVATLTRTGRDGQTVTRDVDRTFTITFPRGDEDAEIAIGGKRFRADRSTGEIASLM